MKRFLIIAALLLALPVTLLAQSTETVDIRAALQAIADTYGENVGILSVELEQPDLNSDNNPYWSFELVGVQGDVQVNTVTGEITVKVDDSNTDDTESTDDLNSDTNEESVSLPFATLLEIAETEFPDANVIDIDFEDEDGDTRTFVVQLDNTQQITVDANTGDVLAVGPTENVDDNNDDNSDDENMSDIPENIQDIAIAEGSRVYPSSSVESIEIEVEDDGTRTYKVELTNDRELRLSENGNLIDFGGNGQTSANPVRNRNDDDSRDDVNDDSRDDSNDAYDDVNDDAYDDSDDDSRDDSDDDSSDDSNDDSSDDSNDDDSSDDSSDDSNDDSSDDESDDD